VARETATVAPLKTMVRPAVATAAVTTASSRGRPADALLAFEEARRGIVEETGADPGPALRALHERILRQDPGPLPESALVS
jgi:DNA-binding SARP family transcriptional activator